MAPPKAAKPSRSIFDPFNSSATGHQRADNTLSGSTAWRDSRHKKLREQFISGHGGGKRVSDTVGAGSLDFGVDGRTENGGWVKGAKGLRGDDQRSILESGFAAEDDADPSNKRQRIDETLPGTKIVNPYGPFRREDGKIRETSWTSHESTPSSLLEPVTQPYALDLDTQQDTQLGHDDDLNEAREEQPQLFKNLVFYINGSTAPAVSDHKLKRIIGEHGGNLSIALARRQVTHVILGRPNSSGGSGGSLAGSKIQKEIQRAKGKAVKYVTAEWVLESIKAGRRLQESNFEALRFAPTGVKKLFVNQHETTTPKG